MSTLKVNGIRHTGASSDSVTLASDGTCSAKITNNLTNRNLLINGAHIIWQRGTSISGGSDLDSFQRAADRFWLYAPDSSSGSVGQSTDAPSGFAYSTYNGLNSECSIGTNVELIRTGFDAPFANGESLTLSFYIKSSSARSNVGITITTRDSSGGTGSVTRASGVSFNSTTGWTRVIKTFTLSGTVGGSNKMLQFEFNLAVGDRVTGFQLEKGDVATDFEHKFKGDELARCQRYYQKYTTISYRLYTPNVIRWDVPLTVKMRSGATVTKSYSSTTNYGQDNTGCPDGTMLKYDVAASPSGQTHIVDNAGGTITLNAEL